MEDSVKLLQTKIRKRMLEVRETLGFTQTSFAEKINMYQNNYGQIEKGRRNLSLNLILSVAQTFQIDINWLFTGDGKMLKTSVPLDISKINSNLDSSIKSFNDLFKMYEKQQAELVETKKMLVNVINNEVKYLNIVNEQKEIIETLQGQILTLKIVK
jgi:DNA-binding XRE family transcriptional regulator